MLRLKKTSGMTLIEIVVMVIIIAVGVTLAVPSFLSFLQKRRLMITVDRFYAVILNARSEAIKRNTSVFVSTVTGDNWCLGVNTGSACTCSVPSSCDLGTIQAEQAQQLTLSTTSLVSNGFQFENTRGASNVSNGKITLTIYGQSTSVTVYITRLGNVQQCSTLSGYQTCP